GPRGSGSSIRSVTISGMSSVVGLLYSRNDGNLCTRAPERFSGRRRNACSSMSASPRPMYTLPSTWPRARTGLIERPMSWAIQTFGTWIHPVAGSTPTSTTAAVYEYVGDGPTPPPLNFAADGGGVYEPTVPSVPNFASATHTPSRNSPPVSGLSTSNTRRPANASRSFGTP